MIQVKQQQHHPSASAAPGPASYEPAIFQTADVTVSLDGSGKFKQIMDAIAAAPSHSQKQFVIFVKKGVYKEYVKIDKTKMNLVLIGEGMSVTTISGDRSNGSGWQTIDLPTFAEYMNNGLGASVSNSIKWPGFHVITEASKADSFKVTKFIVANSWPPSTGVPFAPGL